MQFLVLLCSICLILKASKISKASVTFRNNSVEDAFRAYYVVPDIIPEAPEGLIKIKFPSGVNVKLGTVTQPRFVRSPPVVNWIADGQAFHTLVMTDPDAGDVSEVRHWLIGNIPGNAVAEGKVITEYLGSAAPSGSGLHRYIFLAYEQPNGEINFNESYTAGTDFNFRPFFSVRDFALKYELGKPVAGNLFFAEWDESVNSLREILGFP